jgi:hypothetical protein
MPYTTHLDPATRLARIRFHGTVTGTDLLAATRALYDQLRQLSPAASSSADDPTLDGDAASRSDDGSSDQSASQRVWSLIWDGSAMRSFAVDLDDVKALVALKRRCRAAQDPAPREVVVSYPDYPNTAEMYATLAQREAGIDVTVCATPADALRHVGHSDFPEALRSGAS